MKRKMKFAIILTLIFFLFTSPVFSENKTSQVNPLERIEILEYEKVVAVNGNICKIGTCAKEEPIPFTTILYYYKGIKNN